jgi:hypothetical protein
VVETDLGRGILGVVDGAIALGVESDDDAAARKFRDCGGRYAPALTPTGTSRTGTAARVRTS